MLQKFDSLEIYIVPEECMDNALRELMQKASARGSNYVKGDATLEELPGKMAELGVFLLENWTT